MSNTSRGGAGDSELPAGRPTWAEVDLDALASNFHTVRRRVGPGVRVMAVLKANAYGHGSVECARRLARAGVDWFGVATVEEGLELRRAGLREPVLCFGGFWEGQAAACVRENLTPVLYRLDMAEALDSAARGAGITADAHVKVDTGMGRLGVRHEEAAEFARALRAFTSVRVEGLMTHFAVADDPDRDCFTSDQVARFSAAVSAFRERGHAPSIEHMANSAAALAHPETRGNMVRPGGVLYGLWRDVLPASVGDPGLRPVMSLRTRVALVKPVHRGETLGYGCTFVAARETRVATVPAGYHDGYTRALSNRGRVVVRGQFAPVVGRISMDLTLVDVTDVAGVRVGDVVTLLGGDGARAVPAEDLAKTAGTISYEITCGVSHRVPRVYLERENFNARDGRDEGT